MAENGKKRYWTNERHVHFLNSMEASFVESMFQNNNGRLRLDRYLPDASESTEDLVKERRRRHSTSANRNGASREWSRHNQDIVESSGTRTDRRTRILSTHQSSQDQVVPQFHKKRDDRDEDENS